MADSHETEYPWIYKHNVEAQGFVKWRVTLQRQRTAVSVSRRPLFHSVNYLNNMDVPFWKTPKVFFFCDQFVEFRKRLRWWRGR